MITLENKVLKNQQTAYRNLDGEGLIMNPADSMLHSLSEVGCFVWELLSSERSVSEIIEAVLGEYKVEEKTAKEDIFELLKILADLKLVTVS